ncbi:hypothetical protein PR048_018164 [Dryococelus australis]|uniref:Carboxylic ester hydrolase n=1 Tax=Dryococelus australis TaxID=614101 RepID=A0ABQ9HC49_9NEOP|nr:hypothetical protein PR048_018164 [Dryococelus australis]
MPARRYSRRFYSFPQLYSSAVAPTVKIAQGTLRGAEGKSADGTTFYKFLGIPYARPPVGNLRFAAPQEPVAWSGVREATSFGNHCLQTSESGGSEDCLYLNVYTPELRRADVTCTSSEDPGLNRRSFQAWSSTSVVPVRSTSEGSPPSGSISNGESTTRQLGRESTPGPRFQWTAEDDQFLLTRGRDPIFVADRSSSSCQKSIALPRGEDRAALLPVMVAIHGGAFVAGSGNIGPGQLIDHGVVVVSINYRLNVFGFMSIEGTDAPGNAGLKDQVAALKWVKNNVEHFGGNPNSVTIFGMSAGGASVHYHVLSSMSKGLYHRAISESGSALSPFAFNHNNQQSAFELSSLAGKPAKTTSQLLSNLRSVSAAELIKTLPKVTAPKGSTRPFVPSIEFPRTGEEPFLRHSPTMLVKGGFFNSVPYIAGSAKREVAAFYQESTLTSEAYWASINRNYEGYLVPYELGLTLGSEKSKEVAEKVKKFYFGNNLISYQTREQWISVQTDIQFTIGVVTTIRAHAKHSTSKTYNYWLTYGAATHGMEWQYVVYNGKVNGQTSSAAKLAASLGQLWTSFAKTGVPTASGEAAWKPVSTSSYPYLDIDVPNTLKMDVEKAQMDFWFEIYENYRNGTGAR